MKIAPSPLAPRVWLAVSRDGPRGSRHPLRGAVRAYVPSGRLRRPSGTPAPPFHGGPPTNTNTAAISVSNPADGATISAAATASWVEVTSCTETAVGFTVSQNPNTDPRTARVTVSYSYSLAGNKGTAACEITVAQGNADQPALSVQPTAVAADIEGGSYSFAYSVINPASDGEASASCTASWISDIDCSAEGKVGFSVAENTNSFMRTGYIDLSYTSSVGTITESIAVVQDYVASDNEGAPDVSFAVGTYTASGYAYSSDGPAWTEWTLTIYEFDYDTYGEEYNNLHYDIWIDGLTPDVVGESSMGTEYEPGWAAAAYFTGDKIVIPTQLTYYGVSTTSGTSYYGEYCMCTGYDGTYVYYTTNYPEMVFTYDATTGEWCFGDYGVFFAGSQSASITGFYSYFDVVYPDLYDEGKPGITLVKISDSTESSVTNSVGAHGSNTLEPHFNLMKSND